ncbi:hypothetical protein R2F61_02300 [Mollicutes bacterium LVI A0078]|nr:hypothetical protein RZE84_02330 [Mollicutes bacterium LVI A0075]WOO91400.1 hypothetical protein R2F61_02300 [Mollicutes bacterium LVI A0078]
MKTKILYGIIIVVLALLIGYELIQLFGIELFPTEDTGALFCK